MGEGQIVAWAGEVVAAWEAKQENGERSRRERETALYGMCQSMDV